MGTRLFFKINELVTEILIKNPNIKIEFWHEDESRIGQKGHSTRSWFDKGTRQRVLVLISNRQKFSVL